MGLHSINKNTKSYSGGGLPFYLEEEYVFSKLNAGYLGGGEWNVPNAKLPTFQIWSIRDNVIAFKYKGIRADGTYTGAAFSPPIGLITSTAVKKDGVQYYVFSTSDDDTLTTIAAGGRWIIELTIETIIGGATTTYYSEQFVTTECDTTCYSMDLDGVMEYIEAPINAAFDLDRTDVMSFECWVKFDTFYVFNQFFTKYVGSRGILFTVSLGELRLDLQNNGGLNGLIIQSTGAAIITGVWYHLAATYDGSSSPAGVKLYKNGVLLTNGAPISNTLSASIVNAATVQIGRVGSFYVDMKINTARWWNVELTAGEVLTEYNSGSVLTTPVQAASLILNTDINNSTWNGAEYDIPDLTGITAGYQTVNAEVEDLVEDCP
jgi:hypothetical protein